MKIYKDEKSEYESIVIEDDLGHKDDERHYETKMMAGNEIPVFLNCRLILEDEIEKYIYNAKSMQSLKQLSRHSPLSYLELYLLIKSVAECQENMERFLLSKKGLILNPEYIFYKRDEGVLKFVFYPFYDGEIYTEYMSLLEFLLEAVNYDDENAAKLVYELYASVLNKDYELLKYLDENIISEYIDSRQSTTDETDKMAEATEELRCDRLHNYNKKHLSSFSVVCLTLFSVASSILIASYISFRKAFLYYASNMKVLSFVVLILCLLLYFPIMNIYDLSTKSC